MSATASIIGGSGFVGGELIRLLLGHPHVTVDAVASRSRAGRPVHSVHPNLRGHVELKFALPSEVPECDVLFLCMPHGQAGRDIEQYCRRARVVIDLSSDFRLHDPQAYERWYGEPHPCRERLANSVYGLPEVSRAALGDATLISGVGCNATAMNLALLPLAQAGLIKSAIADVKVGSSEAGAEANTGSHHPVRARAVRTYSPSGHRHLAEVEQVLGLSIDATVTAVEMVRGVLCTAHVTPSEQISARDLWGLYREQYASEPFVRIVAERSGMNRLPDPRVLVGSNHADVGFAVDEGSGRVIALCAIDNLVKGAAGSAVQSMNIAMGWPETDALGFPGLHPV